MFQIVSLTRLFELEPRERYSRSIPSTMEGEGSTARREVDQWITKWLGRYRSPPPRKYTTCGEGGGGKERKVNKNLGEITVPGGGKLRLISCTRLSPSCLHLRSRSLTRSNLFPSLSLRCIIFHPPPRERGVLIIIESSHDDVSSAEEKVPDRRISLSSRSEGPRSPLPILLLHLLGVAPLTDDACRDTREPGLSFTSSLEWLSRENLLIEHGKSRSLSLASFLHVRYPFDRNLVVKGRNEEKKEERMKKKRWKIFFEPKESFSNK